MIWTWLPKAVQSLLPLKLTVAWNVLLASAIWALVAYAGGVDVVALLSRPDLPGSRLVASFVLCFCVASLLTEGVGRGVTWYQVRRSKAVAARQAEQAAAREAAALTAEQERKRMRHIRALSSILPDLPDEHRAVLARFYGHDRNVLLTREDSLGGDRVTSALLRAGFISRILTTDASKALYRLERDAASVVTDYFRDLYEQREAAEAARLDAAVRDAGEEARVLLQLFGHPNPTDSEECAHAWMEAPVYDAVARLAADGVLARELDPRSTPMRVRHPRSTELITLTEEGRDRVERFVLGGPVARTSILLDYRQIASTTSHPSVRSKADGVPYPVQYPSGRGTAA